MSWLGFKLSRFSDFAVKIAQSASKRIEYSKFVVRTDNFWVFFFEPIAEEELVIFSSYNYESHSLAKSHKFSRGQIIF